MNTMTGRISIAFLIVVFATALGGCKSESGENASSGTPPPSNNAPVISGAPGTAVVLGNAYSFTPTASDPDGDSLTFSVQNMPVWAEFSNTTGALTGTPLPQHVDTYPNIAISVSDGVLSKSLPQFSVAVVQNADGSITLSWTAPTQNVDGSPLTDLAAYKFYYGTSPGSYSNPPVRVDNPGITTFVIGNLAPGPYYVVATVVNSSGIESGFSNEAIKQVL